MSTISLRIPDSLHNRVKHLAEKDHISINQFIATSVAEKISALETEEYLEERGKEGTRQAFLNVLKKVPDDQPEQYDIL